VYFSGVDVNQLQWFLERFSYPRPIVEFVATNRDNLDHLLFDVGVDYRMEEDALVVFKSGYYGVFQQWDRNEAEKHNQISSSPRTGRSRGTDGAAVREVPDSTRMKHRAIHWSGHVPSRQWR
jgi:hypothetical protein